MNRKEGVYIVGVFPWLKNEWITIIKNRKMMIAIISILFIPSLYSGTYLWANWDPYAHLQRLPVAVVNEDVKVNYKGEIYAIGNDLVDELKKDDNFKWRFVTKLNADMGLKNNQYYFEIYIPPNFSKNATTLTENKPTPLNLYYKVNTGNNFIASQIGRTAVDKIRTKLAESISKNYAEVVFGDINSVGKGLSDASKGSDKISAGLKKLSSGTQEMVTGMQKQVQPISQLSAGSTRLNSAASQLSNGADQLYTGMSKVDGGLDSLGNALNTLNNSSKQLAAGISPLSNRSKQLNQAMNEYQKDHPELASDTSFQQMVQIRQNLNGGLKKYNSSLMSYNQGMNRSAQSSNSLKNGAHSLTLKLKDLSNGASQVSSSQTQIKNGTTNVYNGWNSVISHLKTMKQGEDDLVAGSRKLTDKLDSGAKKIQDIHAGQPIYEMMSNPVRLKEQLLHSVPNYGTGLAPYFLSLSLFVGALLLSTAIPLRNTSIKPPSAIAWFLSKFILLAFISIFHSVITNLFLIHLVGLDPINRGYLYLFTFFTSLIFMSIILFLVMAADNAGRLLAIVLLVLQLTSSAGTFPIELTPKFFQTLNSLLPMSYTVQGFRAIISTGDYHLLRKDLLALSIYLVISIVLTIILLKLLHKKQTKLENVKQG
jgi:putative membrane protein